MASSVCIKSILSIVLATSAATALAQGAVPVIRVGWSIPAEEAKYWMMKKPEAFPDLGKAYRVEWTQFQGTAPMVQAMISNALDCSSQAPLSLGQGAINGGLQAYAVAQHVGESPQSFSVYWGVMEDSPIKTVADLKGKSLGVNVYASGVYAGMALILKKNGMDPAKDVKVIETGFPGSEAALRGGRVDAGVFVQPFASRAEAKGGIRKLMSIQNVMPNTVHLMEVCKKDFADKSPELVKLYVRDLTRAMQMAITQREETIKVVSEVTRAPAAALEPYLMKQNDFARSPDAKPDFAAVQSMFDQYAELGLMSRSLKVEQFRRDDLTAPLR